MGSEMCIRDRPWPGRSCVVPDIPVSVSNLLRLIPKGNASERNETGDSVTDDDRLLTTDDLAAMLRLPKRTVEDWRQRGGGPPTVKLGRHIRYRPADVEEWLAARLVSRG